MKIYVVCALFLNLTWNYINLSCIKVDYSGLGEVWEHQGDRKTGYTKRRMPPHTSAYQRMPAKRRGRRHKNHIFYSLSYLIHPTECIYENL